MDKELGFFWAEHHRPTSSKSNHSNHASIISEAICPERDHIGSSNPWLFLCFTFDEAQDGPGDSEVRARQVFTHVDKPTGTRFEFMENQTIVTYSYSGFIYIYVYIYTISNLGASCCFSYLPYFPHVLPDCRKPTSVRGSPGSSASIGDVDIYWSLLQWVVPCCTRWCPRSIAFSWWT